MMSGVSSSSMTPSLLSSVTWQTMGWVIIWLLLASTEKLGLYHSTTGLKVPVSTSFSQSASVEVS